ncbi:hypothetical protein CEXT_112791 [Caerostris extrusa]|uniref:Uncharacterized protein n=1 Tax=Caerostris extrusa TaxID=172846 RepID=A0AAV4QL59_CAEEX|nr:hypothetical protein CEXT_112791 [Caerostris extrusa]
MNHFLVSFVQAVVNKASPNSLFPFVYLAEGRDTKRCLCWYSFMENPTNGMQGTPTTEVFWLALGKLLWSPSISDLEF